METEFLWNGNETNNKRETEALLKETNTKRETEALLKETNTKRETEALLNETNSKRETASLLNGDGTSKYQPLEDSELDSNFDSESTAALRPWQRWNRKQVVCALVLMTISFVAMIGAKSVGPSLLELQVRTGTSMKQVSWFMSAMGIGSLMGSSLLGLFIDRSSRWLQLCASAILSGVIFAITPWFTNFWLQFLFFVLFGVTSSYTLTGAQLTTYCLFDYYVDSVRWQNVYQIAMSIGGMFGPILAQPFLLEIPSELHSEMHPNNSGNVTSNPPGPADVKIMYAFLVTGSLLVLTGIAAIMVHLAFGSITVYHSTKEAEEKHPEKSQGSSSRNLKILKNSLLILLVLYYISQSMQVRSFNNYLLPFAVNQLGWTKAKGTNLAAAYFASLVASRFIVFASINKVSVEVLLNSGLILVNISALALSFLINYHESVIWIFIIVLGIGTSLTLSVMLAWTDRHVGLKGFIGVLYSIAGAAGTIALNPVIGYLLDNVGYMYLMYVLLMATATCLVLIIAVQILGKQYLKAVAALGN